MSKNELSTFTFGSSLLLRSVAIRVDTIDGEPWFVLADVCPVLELGDYKGSYAHHARYHLDETERRVIPKAAIGISGRGRGVMLISEAGLYKLVMRSDKPQAKPFQDWVTKVVLPAIRKDGMYVAGEENLDLSTDVGLMTMAMRVQEGMKAKIERLTLEAAVGGLFGN